MEDKIIECPMKGGICYETQISPEVKNYMSLSSGYWTNSLMKKDSDFYKEQISILPELYKDMVWEDPKTKLVWVPQTINIQNKGMVFMNGSSKEDAVWAAVKAVEIKEEEKHKYPIKGKEGQYYSFRMDMTTLKNFTLNEFIDALEYIGILEG